MELKLSSSNLCQPMARVDFFWALIGPHKTTVEEIDIFLLSKVQNSEWPLTRIWSLSEKIWVNTSASVTKRFLRIAVAQLLLIILYGNINSLITRCTVETEASILSDSVEWDPKTCELWTFTSGLLSDVWASFLPSQRLQKASEIKFRFFASWSPQTCPFS